MADGNSDLLIFLFSCFLLPDIVRPMCDTDQKSHCMELYQQSTSFWGSSNDGDRIDDCRFKPYAEFTHVCTVSNYLPSIDHCCCATGQQQRPQQTPADDKWGHTDPWRRRRRRRQVPGGDKNLTGDGEEPAEGRPVKRSATPADPSVMCCRYHQDWNKFRCQSPVDVLEPKFLQSTMFSSNFQSISASLLCYGIFVCVIMAFIVLVFCLVRRNNKRKAKARKSNVNSPTAAVTHTSSANDTRAAGGGGTRTTSPATSSYDPSPPPYSDEHHLHYHSPPYKAVRGVHFSAPSPLFRDRFVPGLEPSAPMEEEILLRSYCDCSCLDDGSDRVTDCSDFQRHQQRQRQGPAGRQNNVRRDDATSSDCRVDDGSSRLFLSACRTDDVAILRDCDARQNDRGDCNNVSLSPPSLHPQTSHDGRSRRHPVTVTLRSPSPPPSYEESFRNV